MRVIVVGRFDGVHLGHGHLLSQARALAQARGCPLLAYTFPPEPPALLTLSLKVRLLRDWADEVEVVPLARVQELEAAEFLRTEIRGRLRGCALVMGPDHRFGRGRQAGPEQARKLGDELGLEVLVVEPLQLDGEVVSARRIRELLAQGEVDRAARFLGRPPVLVGRVVPGVGLARRLGFPTLNLELEPVLVRPADGVYVAWAFWPGGHSPGLFYHGKRPTFPTLPPSTEVHLFSPPPPALAGVEVHLLARLRPDQTFPSPQALVHQVEQDVEKARALLSGLTPPRPLLGL